MPKINLTLSTNHGNLRSSLAGCVAVRKISPEICEMKRLFVRPEYRQYGIGKTLALEIIAAARRIGY